MVVFTKEFGTLAPHLPIVWNKVPKKTVFLHLPLQLHLQILYYLWTSIKRPNMMIWVLAVKVVCLPFFNHPPRSTPSFFCSRPSIHPFLTFCAIKLPQNDTLLHVEDHLFPSHLLYYTRCPFVHRKI